MKPISTKEIVKAIAAVKKAEADVKAYNWGGFAARYREDAKAALDKAISALDAAYAPLANEIKIAEGRATARTITAADVIVTLFEIEEGLNISKKSMEGISVDADLNAQAFPSAYKYTPESTHFHAEYKAGFWRITKIYRYKCNASTKRLSVTMTDVAKAAVIGRIENGKF